MNADQHRPAWGLALAAGILALTSACGTTQSIGDPALGKKAERDSKPRPFLGSPWQLGDPGENTPAPHPTGGLPRRGGPDGWN